MELDTHGARFELVRLSVECRTAAQAREANYLRKCSHWQVDFDVKNSMTPVLAGLNTGPFCQAHDSAPYPKSRLGREFAPLHYHLFDTTSILPYVHSLKQSPVSPSQDGPS